MIMTTLDDNLDGPGEKRNREVVTLHQGGVHLTLRSRSRFVALRSTMPTLTPKSRTLSMFPLNVSNLSSRKTTKQTFHRDASKSLMVPFAARTMKICASQMALALLRETSLPPGIIVPWHDVAQKSAADCNVSPSSSNRGVFQIPRIIITPPDDCSVSLNLVPMPQDADFGMQLTVPDPEFSVINRTPPHDSSPEHQYGYDLLTNFFLLGAKEDTVSQSRDQNPGWAFVEHEDGDDGKEEALDLGHTWSG